MEIISTEKEMEIMSTEEENEIISTEDDKLVFTNFLRDQENCLDTSIYNHL